MSEVKYKVCSRCGAQMEIEEGVICTSIPPMYRYRCPKCGAMEFDVEKYPMPVVDLDKNFGSVAPPFFFDWQAFRAEAAKDLIPFAARMKDYRGYPCDIVMEAILLADELIKQLKEDEK